VPDEGVHEIQLNGKQLVFLFMSGTVVAVVIFLCGVMVGRGVRAERGGETIAATADAPVDPTASVQAPLPAAASSSEGLPVASQETLTYPDRLEDPTPPAETLRDVPEAAASRPSSRTVPSPPERAAPAAAPAASPIGTASEPAGNGFVVQVAAVRERGEADGIARRLAAKGYPSFVTTPANGTPNVFRVRVGKYPDRREAETIATRLQKEEQFKPWVTR